MNSFHSKKSAGKQNGAAVLLVSILLLIGVTLITVFAARVGVMDQRISANEYRHKEAYVTSEAGIEQAHSYIRYRDGEGQSFFDLNDLISCGGATDFPCGDGTINLYSHYFDGNTGALGKQPLEYVTSLPNSADFDAYIVYNSGDSELTVLSEGSSVDGTGDVDIEQRFSQKFILTTGPVPPLMAPVGSLSGSFRIVPNPNGNTIGSEDKFGNKSTGGFPLSLWIKTPTFSGGGSNFKTCLQDYYRAGGNADGDICDEYDLETDWEGKNCDCIDPGGTAKPANEVDSLLSNKDGGVTYIDRDIVSGGDFPDSIIKYAFGVDDVSDLIGISHVITDCNDATLSALDLTLSSFVYIGGDCTVSVTQLGSKTYPIILLVNGDYTMNGNDKHLWGLVYSSGKAKVTGTPTVHGALLSETEIDVGAGTYNQIYDPDVFEAFANNGLATTTGPVQYSKTDTK